MYQTGERAQGWAGPQQKPQPLSVSSLLPAQLHYVLVMQGNEFCSLDAFPLEPCFLGHLCLDPSAEHKRPFYTLFCETCTCTKIRLDTVHKQTHLFAGKAGEDCIWEKFGRVLLSLTECLACTVHPGVAEGRTLFSHCQNHNKWQLSVLSSLSAPLLCMQFIFLP